MLGQNKILYGVWLVWLDPCSSSIRPLVFVGATFIVPTLITIKVILYLRNIDINAAAVEQINFFIRLKTCYADRTVGLVRTLFSPIKEPS